MSSLVSTPPEHATDQGSRAWWAAILIFVFFQALPNLSYPIGRDQATYCVIGEGLLRGQALYRDLWDIKPPGIYYTYALIVKLFGQVMWSVGLVDVLWLLATSYGIIRYARIFVGPTAAGVAAAVNACWHCRAGYVHAAQPETFLVLCAFAGYFVITSGGGAIWFRHFTAGLLLGGAFWLKYNAMAFVPFLLVVPYFDWQALDAHPRVMRLLIPWCRWIARATALGAGFGTAIVVVLGMFAWAGLWGEFWESHVRVVLRYGIAPVHLWSDYWLVPLIGTIYRVGFWTLLAIVLAVVVARRKGDWGALAPLLFAATVGYASALGQIRFQTYAFETAYPFLAMVWGYLAARAWDYWCVRKKEAPVRKWRRVESVVGILVLSGALWALCTEGANWVRRYRGLADWAHHREEFFANYPAQYPLEHLEGQMKVLRLLRTDSSPGDGLYVWGTAPLLYFLSGLRPPTRFIPNHPLMSPWAPAAWKQELIADLRKSPPAFLVVARQDSTESVTSTHLDSEQYLQVFRELQEVISSFYQPEATFDEFVVYRLRKH
jgi:hypothetical protein